MEYNNIIKEKEKKTWTKAIVNGIGKFFYKHGTFVANRPITVMVVMFVVSCAAGAGFMNIKLEKKPEKLWIPQESDFVKTLEWQRSNYPDINRFALMIFQAENVLAPENMRQMLKMQDKVKEVNITDESGGLHFADSYCKVIPAFGKRVMEKVNDWKRYFMGDAEMDDSGPADLSLKLDSYTYCQLFNMMPTACLSIGLHEIWRKEDPMLNNLTKENIINSVNYVNQSASFSFPLNFTKLLGGVTRNSMGEVIAAKTAMFVFIMEVDMDEVRDSKRTKELSAGFSTDVDQGLYDWEGEFVNMVLQERETLTNGLWVWPQTIRSFTQVSEETIFDDVKLLAIGVTILSFYVLFMLGKMNCVEARPILCFFGLLATLLSVIMSFGFCAGIGIIYGPIHSILPLLLLGLGVDDMFVIVQSLQNLHTHSEKAYIFPTVESKMAKAFENAGAAITVTSLTDFMAFLIGSLTSLPALSSFCLYAACGVFALYIMQITFFFAAFTLDQKRLEDSRNSLFCCVKHDNWTGKDFSEKDFCQKSFEAIYSKILMKPSSKAFILFLTVAMTGVGIWGTTQIRQEFNMIWFIPQSSYVHQFMMKLKEFYPESGNLGNVFLDNVTLPEELSKVEWLTEKLEESPWISQVESWYPRFREYTLLDENIDISKEKISSEFFQLEISKFLFSTYGAKFASFFYFDDNVECGETAPNIKATKIRFRHTNIQIRSEQIEAMENTKMLVRQANFSGMAACTSLSYSEWETNKLIVKELIQNMTLALVAVFIMTSLLIVNIWSSILVMICVLCTLVDVLALMAFWGLTIDTVTCVNLVLCVGLSVDYSAHVALHFMKVYGSKKERVIKMITEVGPPVFNGAFSTFLAFVFLSHSQSHVFESFFKIFFGVFIFGIFHGLVFLPVALSLWGPEPYPEEDQPSTYSGAAVTFDMEKSTKKQRT